MNQYERVKAKVRYAPDGRTSLPVDAPWHDTAGGYTNHICRCDGCRRAWAAAIARLRARRVAQGVVPADAHGSEITYQNWGCRCDACRRAATAARRERRSVIVAPTPIRTPVTPKWPPQTPRVKSQTGAPMTTETETHQLDIDYVRTVGEEVHARLFPRPKRLKAPDGTDVEGPTPIPLPVAITYAPYEDMAPWEVLFIRLRSVQWVGNPDVEDPGDLVRVIWDGHPFDRDLGIGAKPAVPDRGEPRERAALAALLRAIVGQVITP